MIIEFRNQVLAALLVLGVGAVVYVVRHQEPVIVKVQRSHVEQDLPQNVGVTVHIAGAVRFPGVYTMASDSRVVTVIQLAGGVLDSADVDSLNLAQLLVDGQRVYIPFLTGYSLDSKNSGGDGGLVDINNASQKELETLPGIGAYLARQIIEYRGSHGFIRSEDELLEVKGIGPKLLAKIKDGISL